MPPSWPTGNQKSKNVSGTGFGKSSRAGGRSFFCGSGPIQFMPGLPLAPNPIAVTIESGYDDGLRRTQSLDSKTPWSKTLNLTWVFLPSAMSEKTFAKLSTAYVVPRPSRSFVAQVPISPSPSMPGPSISAEKKKIFSYSLERTPKASRSVPPPATVRVPCTKLIRFEETGRHCTGVGVLHPSTRRAMTAMAANLILLAPAPIIPCDSKNL